MTREQELELKNIDLEIQLAETKCNFLQLLRRELVSAKEAKLLKYEAEAKPPTQTD
jgi:hypothetical protein